MLYAMCKYMYTYIRIKKIKAQKKYLFVEFGRSACKKIDEVDARRGEVAP